MVEKLLQRLEKSTNVNEVETITKFALERWIDDTLSEDEYNRVLDGIQAATKRLTPKTVAETTITVAPKGPALPRDVCQKCKAPLSNYQIMMGTSVCVECDRRTRNRTI
jgi:hypothetical protein